MFIIYTYIHRVIQKTRVNFKQYRQMLKDKHIQHITQSFFLNNPVYIIVKIDLLKIIIGKRRAMIMKNIYIFEE